MRLEMTETIRIPKLLIVDDHSPTRKWLRSELRDIADNIFESADGSEAVAAYDEIQPEWVVMDIEMSPMDGLTATRLILEQYPSAKILVVSTHQEAAMKAAALKAGAVCFVSKEEMWQLREILAGYSWGSPEGGLA
jgi:DNA-binding NarL/FixJ family response regulator